MSIDAVEKKAKIVFWVEAVIVFLEAVRIIAFILAITLFVDEFEEYVLENLPNVESLRDSIRSIIKFAILYWVIWFLIYLALLLLLWRGIKKRHPRRLRHWVIFGWIIVFLIGLALFMKLLQNEWSSPLQIGLTIFGAIYAIFRIWANLVILVFVDEIKLEVHEACLRERGKNVSRPSIVLELA